MRKLVGQGRLLGVCRVRLSPLVAVEQRGVRDAPCESRLRSHENVRVGGGSTRTASDAGGSSRADPSLSASLLESSPPPSGRVARVPRILPGGARGKLARYSWPRGTPPGFTDGSRDTFPERWRAHKLPSMATHDAHGRQMADTAGKAKNHVPGNPAKFNLFLENDVEGSLLGTLPRSGFEEKRNSAPTFQRRGLELCPRCTPRKCGRSKLVISLACVLPAAFPFRAASDAACEAAARVCFRTERIGMQ